MSSKKKQRYQVIDREFPVRLTIRTLPETHYLTGRLVRVRALAGHSVGSSNTLLRCMAYSWARASRAYTSASQSNPGALPVARALQLGTCITHHGDKLRVGMKPCHGTGTNQTARDIVRVAKDVAPRPT